MDPTELFVLGLGVLNHEADMHKILADILEEQGELGLAQWARSRKSSRHKRLDFVLAILPYTIGMRIACEFSERALQLLPMPQRRRRRAPVYIQTQRADLDELIRSVVALRHAMTDPPNLEAMLALLPAVLRLSADNGPHVQEIRELMLELHFATSCVLLANQYRAMNDYRGERTQTTGCRTAVRTISKNARQLVAVYRREVIRENELTSEWKEYPNWQYEHLQKFLAELIEKPNE